jgi:hypothetical protein
MTRLVDLPYPLRIEELLYSLTTLLVRYHDSQRGVTKLITGKDELRKKSRTCATEIILDKDKDHKVRLDELIKECTDGYPGRKPFLHFILHEINFLKSMLEKKSSFTPDELKDYKNKVLQLLIDCKTLLQTPKSKTCEVTHSKFDNGTDATIALSGLINDGYYGSELCNSGNLLVEEVLGTLNITVSDKDEELRTIADQLCSEHQNALKVPELEAQNVEQKKALEDSGQTTKKQDDEIARLRQQISEYRNGIVTARLPLGMAAATLPASFFGLNRFAQSRSSTSVEKESDFRFEGPE